MFRTAVQHLQRVCSGTEAWFQQADPEFLCEGSDQEVCNWSGDSVSNLGCYHQDCLLGRRLLLHLSLGLCCHDDTLPHDRLP